jgi:hypothetical protein
MRTRWWQTTRRQRPTRHARSASWSAVRQLTPSRPAVAPSAAKQASRSSAGDGCSWAKATAVAIGQIVSSMRRRSGLQQAVGDVCRPPGSDRDAARERLIRSAAPLLQSRLRGSVDTAGPQTAGPARGGSDVERRPDLCNGPKKRAYRPSERFGTAARDALPFTGGCATTAPTLTGAV